MLLLLLWLQAGADHASAAITDRTAANKKMTKFASWAALRRTRAATCHEALQARYYRPDKPSATDKPRIIGYTAADQVTLRARDLAKLGDLIDMSLSEESVPGPRPLARAMVASGAAAPVPVEAGEMTLSVRVRVVWSLAD
jgi:uncharacterized protein YggE